MNDRLARSQLTLWLLVVVATSIRALALTDARRLPTNAETFPSRGSSRGLLGVYDVTACAWVEDTVCELSPDYGRLLYSETDAPLQQMLFRRSDCFTARLRGDCESIGTTESDQYCTWATKGKDERCRYKTKNFGEDAEECSVPRMKQFNSLDMRCKAFRHTNCPTKLGCTVAQIPNVGRVCRPSGTNAVDTLLDSAISQADILRVLIRGASLMKDLTVPTIEEAQSATEQEGLDGGARRRLAQSEISFGLQRETGRSSGVLSVKDDRPLSVSGAGAQATDGQHSPAVSLSFLGDDGLGTTVRSINPGPVVEITEEVVEITESPPPPEPVSTNSPTTKSPKPKRAQKPKPEAPVVGDTKPASRAQKNKETGDSIDMAPPKSEKGSGDTVTPASDTRGKKSASLTAPKKQGGAKKIAGSTSFDLDDILPRLETEQTGTKPPATKSPSQVEQPNVVGEGTRNKSPLSKAGATKNTTPAAVDFSSGDDTALIRNNSEQLQKFTPAAAQGGKTTLGQNLGAGVDEPCPECAPEKPFEEMESNLLTEIVIIITNLSTVMSLKSMKLTGPSITEIQESLRVATRSLDNLRKSLDLSDFEPDKRYHQVVDEVWWKLELGAQDGAKSLQGRELSRAIYHGGIKILEAYFQINETWPEDKLASHKEELENGRKKLESAISQHHDVLKEELKEEPEMVKEEIKDLGDLVSLFVKTVNESFHEVYPIQLDSGFVKGYNQTWVHKVATRNQRWHDIRLLISNISNMGEQLQSVVSETHVVLSRATPQSGGAKPINTEGVKGMELGNLVNDMVGALVAIYENDHFPDPHPVPDDESDKVLDKWQTGPPISREDLWGVIQNVTMDMHNSIKDFQKPIDELTRILEAVVLITEAKIYPRARDRIDLPPSPQESSIVLMLDSVQRLAYEWAYTINGKQRNIFGSFAHSREELDLNLAGCAGLGGINPESCSFDRTNCAVTELPGWMLGDTEIQTTTDTFCWPRNVVSSRILDGMEDKAVASLLLADLLQASVVCVMRAKEECRVDDLCEFSGVGDCQISSNFAQFKLQNVSLASMSTLPTEESCKRFLDLPTCHDFQDAKTCQATHGCLWASTSPPNATLYTSDLPLLSEAHGINGGNETDTEDVPVLSGNIHSGVDEVDGPGFCLDDWVEQIVHVTELPEERQNILNSKHDECLQQTSFSQCLKVDADAEDFQLGPSSVPRGTASISKWGLAVIPILGTVFMAAIALFACKMIKRNRKRAPVKAKKKGARNGRRVLGGAGGVRPGGRGAGKKAKKGIAEGKPLASVQMIRKPPTFTTVISPTMATSSPDEKESNFAFVLGTISGSADSSSSSLRVPHSQDNQEIIPVTESDGDMTESSWTSSSTAGWSDSEPEGEAYQH